LSSPIIKSVFLLLSGIKKLTPARHGYTSLGAKVWKFIAVSAI